ncbi:hypothetical protein B7463_g6436, partial [Scytalidium lignicola]
MLTKQDEHTPSKASNIVDKIISKNLSPSYGFDGEPISYEVNGDIPRIGSVGRKAPTVSNTPMTGDMSQSSVAETPIDYLQCTTSSSLSGPYHYNSRKFAGSPSSRHKTCYYPDKRHSEHIPFSASNNQLLLDRNTLGSNPAYGFPVKEVYPGMKFPTQEQLDIAWGYALRRENGSYTRLVPADLILPWVNIPKYDKPEGLIIIPTLHAIPSGTYTEADHSGDDSHSISPPTHLLSGWHHFNVRDRYSKSNDNDVQHAIDNILSKAPLNEPIRTEFQTIQSKPLRRKKIYCDKWVHEGVCAFTQQGCKYKHEMPMDRATQLELGLNNGLPFWWRCQQSAKLQSISNSPRSDSSRVAGPWRRNGLMPSRFEKSLALDELSYSRARSFGPVGSPVPQMSL